jgi:putative addiction module killer protein
MLILKPLPVFTAWLESLSDNTVRAVLVARLKRLERGIAGEVQPVGEGVFELRIHLGAGWRIYFTRRGAQIAILLAGGSKRTQRQDMKPKNGRCPLPNFDKRTTELTNIVILKFTVRLTPLRAISRFFYAPQRRCFVVADNAVCGLLTPCWSA